MRAGTGARPDRRLIVAIAVVAWVGIRAHPAVANSTGIGGFSGKRGAQNICNACHGGGVAPDVRFEGPMQVEAGATGTYRFVVKSNAAAQDKAGFNVAVGDSVNNQFAGLFTPGDGARAVSPGFRQCPQTMLFCEITHMLPQSVDVNAEAAWAFTWRAPETLGTYIFYGAGNSVNTDELGATGDRASATTYMVEVVAAQPTEVPTATENATATPTPTATPLATETMPGPTPAPTNTSTIPATLTPTASVTRTRRATNTRHPTPTGPRPCPGDCNGDGNVSTAELVLGVGIALDNFPVEQCRNFDLDLDGVIFIDELTTGIAASLNGCQ